MPCTTKAIDVPVVVRMDNRRGRLEIVNESQIRIEDGYRYFVNVGSVGQPRDSNPDACMVVLDEDVGTLEFFRIPYDITTCQDKIIAEGLPSYLAERLVLAR